MKQLKGRDNEVFKYRPPPTIHPETGRDVVESFVICSTTNVSLWAKLRSPKFINSTVADRGMSDISGGMRGVGGTACPYSFTLKFVFGGQDHHPFSFQLQMNVPVSWDEGNELASAYWKNQTFWFLQAIARGGTQLFYTVTKGFRPRLQIFPKSLMDSQTGHFLKYCPNCMKLW